MVKKFGYATVRSVHEPVVVRQNDGEIFNTIGNGKNTMLGYAAQIPVEDRWAIAAYIRALQLSQEAPLADLPPAEQQRLQGEKQ
jgi:mono/diheme cytochrome c family protein